MFEQITEVHSGSKSKPWSFAASITMQTLLAGAALALPLLRVGRIDTRLRDIVLVPRPIGFHEIVQRTAAENAPSSSSTILRSARSYKLFQQPSSIPRMAPNGSGLARRATVAIGTAGGTGYPNGIPGVGMLPDLADGQIVPAPPQLRVRRRNRLRYGWARECKPRD